MYSCGFKGGIYAELVFLLQPLRFVSVQTVIHMKGGFYSWSHCIKSAVGLSSFFTLHFAPHIWGQSVFFLHKFNPNVLTVYSFSTPLSRDCYLLYSSTRSLFPSLCLMFTQASGSISIPLYMSLNNIFIAEHAYVTRVLFFVVVRVSIVCL